MSAWEIIAITLVIGGAVAYLGHRIWRKLSGLDSAAGCGTGCGSCAHNSTDSEPKTDLVSLDSLASSADRTESSRN